MGAVVVRRLKKETNTAACSSKADSVEVASSLGVSESTATSEGHEAAATPADSLSVCSDGGHCLDAEASSDQSDKSVLCLHGLLKLARQYNLAHPLLRLSQSPTVLADEVAAAHAAISTSEVAVVMQPTEERSCSGRVSTQPCLSFAARDPLPGLIRERLQGPSLALLAKELHADEWPEGSLMAQCFEALGATEVEALPWFEPIGPPDAFPKVQDAVSKMRMVRMRVPLPAIPMCPRTTRQTMSYRITVAPPLPFEKSNAPTISIESSGISHDAPFGNKFVVEERIVLRPDGAGAGGVVVEQFGRCHFHESCGMLQSRIGSSTISGIQRSARNLVALLQDRASAPISCASAGSCVPELVAQNVGAECATCLAPAMEGCSGMGRMWWPRALPRRKGASCTGTGTGPICARLPRRGAGAGAAAAALRHSSGHLNS